MSTPIIDANTNKTVCLSGKSNIFPAEHTTHTRTQTFFVLTKKSTLTHTPTLVFKQAEAVRIFFQNEQQ